MGRLFKAFLFKLTRDLTFRITLIIGAGMALLMTGIYLAIDLTAAAEGSLGNMKFLTGQTMLVASMSPAQNYGLAIPINVVSFICLEFSQGTIRNKIIAGNSKVNIYISLFLSGLVFCISLLSVYVLLCFGIGTIFGGFDPNGQYMLGGYFSPEYIVKMIVVCLLAYLSIISFTVFISTTFRSIGPCIPIVIVVIVMLTLFGTLFAGFSELFENDTMIWISRIFNPLYAINASEYTQADEYAPLIMTITNETFIPAICSNIFYATLFFGFGALEFKKRDVK